jgi:uncharacterized protein with von Willebrand factor type A (vWA) domain
MPVGTAHAVGALEAAAEVGLSRRDDFYWALHAALVRRPEHRPLFDEAFRILWREPGPLPGGLELLLSRSALPPPAERPPISRRLAEALARRGEPREDAGRSAGVDAALEWSDREVLRTRDFEQMSAEELRQAERAIDRMRLPVPDLPARRMRPDPRGSRVDPRATLRASLRAGGEAVLLRRRSPTRRPPAVVALCDVSGSMAHYSRMLLRFLHALTARRGRVHSFTFGTRLTNVTRWLRHRDPDEALAALGRTVPDWEGGTRIGACLREFNLRWSRRVLGQGAVVLLVTDGLDREGARGLAEETARLRRSCRRLVWLNPLLRYQGFEPRAEGVCAMLPHVHDFRPVHDLDSLERLAEALSGKAAPFRSRDPLSPSP